MSSFTTTPSTLAGGSSSSASVTLTGSAPPGGATVALSSSDAAATAPASLVIPAGQSSGSFTITTAGVAAQVNATITATYNGSLQQTLTVQPSTLNTMVVNPTSVMSADPSTATVSLTGNAPPSGATITLSSSNTSVATVPASVVIPAGVGSANFVVTTKPIQTSGSSVISGTFGGLTRSATLTTTACSMGAASPPASFPAGDTVWLEDAVPPSPTTAYATWTWTTAQKASGTQSHTQPSANHWFTNGPTSWTVSSTDKLVVYVLTDKCNPPREIMLEFSYGADWEHRAFWGENLITDGVLGTASRYRVGDLPPAGVWTRLEVPAATVGMGGQRVYGLSFRIMYGQTWFDRFGKAPQSSGQNLVPPGSLEVQPIRTAEVSPATQPVVEGATLVNARGPRFGRIRGWVSRNVAQRVKRVLRRRPNEPPQQPPVSMAMAAQIVANAGPTSRRYSFYSPELNLIAESEYTEGASPAIAHEYIWFGGQPVAQIEAATSTPHWTFTDHLGTPILQTDGTSAVTWRGESEPYGQLHQLHTGENRHQPLRFPGQEAQQMDDGINGFTERSYNIFRWYRAASGKYGQADPLAIYMPDAFLTESQPNHFAYAMSSPIRFVDPVGLKPCCECPQMEWDWSGWGSGIGAFVGLSYSQGEFTCTSKPSVKLKVKATCIQWGIVAYLDVISYEFGLPKLGIVAEKACNARDLLEHDGDFIGSGKGGVGVEGNPFEAKGNVSVGAGYGFVLGLQKCWLNTWKWRI